MSEPLPDFPPELVRVRDTPKPPPFLEADLQKAVIDTARIFGYRVAHFRPAQTKHGWRTAVAGDGAGFPDCVIVGNGRVLYRELKVGRNTLSDEQAGWLEALREAGVDAGVWTDADWHSGLVEAELRRGTKHEVAS